MANALYDGMRLQRQKVPDGPATSRAIDHRLQRSEALTRILEDGDLPIDSCGEDRARSIAIGRQSG